MPDVGVVHPCPGVWDFSYGAIELVRDSRTAVCRPVLSPAPWMPRSMCSLYVRVEPGEVLVSEPW